jgi:hypothetical protein
MVRSGFSFLLVSFFAWQACAAGPVREPAANVAEAANAWLDALTPAQRRAATTTFADLARLVWGY